MKLSTLRRIPGRWRARAMRLGFNMHPAFRTSGGKVLHVSQDLSHIRICLRFSRRTRNLVGSLYGGSLFAVTDGAHVSMLLARIERDVIVWDKSATIRFRKPAYRTLYADFHISQDDIYDICSDLDREHQTSRQYTVELKDREGTVYTIVERVVYIADKSYYKSKKG
jgi:acyl-coenzyme A thioesterase PaaI-like protein